MQTSQTNRRKGWVKICMCRYTPQHAGETCSICGKIIYKLKRKDDMKNEINFQTGDIPAYIDRAGFP